VWIGVNGFLGFVFSVVVDLDFGPCDMSGRTKPLKIGISKLKTEGETMAKAGISGKGASKRAEENWPSAGTFQSNSRLNENRERVALLWASIHVKSVFNP